jgi:hypothetical protein
MQSRAKLREKLTYANVVSTLCLFLLLGGGAAYARSHLAKNSVGSRQIKKNAVTKVKIKKNAVSTPKIVNNAVTGAKVNESTLGTVPSANALTPPEAVHLVGTPGEPPFEKGSSNSPPNEGFSPQLVGFYKDHEGIVHLQGAAKNPAEEAIFTLPPGYRPASGFAELFDQRKFGAVYVFGPNTSGEGIDVSNEVFTLASSEVILDGITFRAES